MGRYLEIWDEARFVEINESSEQDITKLLNYINERYYAADGDRP